jgi:hypothetical protein
MTKQGSASRSALAQSPSTECHKRNAVLSLVENIGLGSVA